MLGFQSPLFFPYLNAQIEKPLKRRTKSSMIFSINWRKLDDLKDSNSPIQSIFAEKWLLRYVDGFHFVLDGPTLREIHRVSRVALIESHSGLTGHNYEVTHRIVETAMLSVFKILGDCLYDPDENFYSRGVDKILAPHLMAWRFWAFQTGEGCIRGNAAIDEMSKRLNQIELENDEAEFVADVEKILTRTELELWPEERREWDIERSKPAYGPTYEKGREPGPPKLPYLRTFYPKDRSRQNQEQKECSHQSREEQEHSSPEPSSVCYGP